MEPWEIRNIRHKIKATREDMAKLMKTKVISINRWEEGSPTVSPKKAAILEALNILVKRLENEHSIKDSGIDAADQLRTVLIKMGAENFLILLAKEQKESLPRSCWRRLAAVIPAIGLIIGAPVGMFGEICNSQSVRNLLGMLRFKSNSDQKK